MIKSFTTLLKNLKKGRNLHMLAKISPFASNACSVKLPSLFVQQAGDSGSFPRSGQDSVHFSGKPVIYADVQRKLIAESPDVNTTDKGGPSNRDEDLRRLLLSGANPDIVKILIDGGPDGKALNAQPFSQEK
ncbi:MAG: hypothetical protein K2X66_09945 [Cyanobacteria bacterium]|nr:hypothetical protein [Cyanobacteriota bacterium]